MNGGAPSIPLRAVRVGPVLVDDLVIPREFGRDRTRRGQLAAEVLAPEPDLLRWTRAWLVAWQAALCARAVIGTADAWTVGLTQAEWPTLRGDPDRRRQRAAVDLLVGAALAQLTAAGVLRLCERVFVPHRAGLEVDWSAAYQACRAEPASLLTLRAIVDCLPALDDPGPVTLRELATRTGYGEKQVRIALHRLVEARVLATREAAGQPTQYRLTDAFLGRSGDVRSSAGPKLALAHEPDLKGSAHAPASGSGPEPTPGALGPRGARHGESPSPSARSSPALRLSFNGATVALAPGLSASVELDEDGVPHLHVGGSPRT